MTESKDATAHTVSTQSRFRDESPMDWSDRTDFDNARRGLVARPQRSSIDGPGSAPAWNLADYSFLGEVGDGTSPEAPATVNPSLWRQAQLNMEAGLFTIADRIHQLRGFDLSEITVIEGDSGFIVIDPLVSVECAAEAMELGADAVLVNTALADARDHGAMARAFAMATEAGVMNVMAGAAKHYFTHAEAIGAGGDFVPMLSNHVGALNGLDMAAEVKKGR